MEDKMTKSFEVSSVCRLDLTEFISIDEAKKITDDQMEHLARKMGDVFCDTSYWEAMETWLKNI